MSDFRVELIPQPQAPPGWRCTGLQVTNGLLARVQAVAFPQTAQAALALEFRDETQAAWPGYMYLQEGEPFKLGQIRPQQHYLAGVWGELLLMAQLQDPQQPGARGLYALQADMHSMAWSYPQGALKACGEQSLLLHDRSRLDEAWLEVDPQHGAVLQEWTTPQAQQAALRRFEAAQGQPLEFPAVYGEPHYSEELLSQGPQSTMAGTRWRIQNEALAPDSWRVMLEVAPQNQQEPSWRMELLDLQEKPVRELLLGYAGHVLLLQSRRSLLLFSPEAAPRPASGGASFGNG